MFKILEKARDHMRRKALARRFGVAFSRRATFSVPGSILLHGQKVALSLPDDLGVKNDFVGCVLEDCYGLRQLPFEPRTILDIGANVGLFSIAAREFYPKATIHAYEPNPRTLAYVRENARKADFTLFDEAVGAEDGRVEISDVAETNMARTQPLQGQSSQGVPQISFKTVLSRIGGAVDLLKIDCEGAEWELLKLAECWMKIRLIRMEYHLFEVHSFAELSSVLEGLGFSIVRHYPSIQCGMVWCERKSR